MLNSIRRGFGRLLRFGGRDSRSEFWPFAGAITAIYMVIVSPIIMIMAFVSVSASHRTGASAAVQFVLYGLIMFATAAALLAAAVARRLHDSGLSAYWGLLPLPFAALSLTLMSRLAARFGSGGDDIEPFLWYFISLISYFAAVIGLIVLLVRPTAPGENRFD
jgi:uncharacterized membrane protein YhaH (DUF805 family)